MREDDSDWFSRWEEELPRPEDLTPLSQTLITPDLALAFGIQPQSQTQIHPIANRHVFLHQQQDQAAHQAPPPAPNPGSADFDSSELGGGGSGSGSGGDDAARPLKRPRLVWTPQLHKRFVDAVAHLGIKNAVPKTIMQLMSVDGLTRENVASHLQKYRLYLKRMQGLGGGTGGGSGDPATDHLFASSPVPAHFLHPQGGVGPVGGVRQSSEYYKGYAPPPSPAAAMAAMVAGGQYHHRQLSHFGSPTNWSFEHPFLSRQAHMGVRIGGGGGVGVVQNPVGGYVLDDVVESGTAANGRRVLTLFPTGHD